MPALVGPNEGILYDWDLGEFYKTDLDDTLRLIDGVLHLGVIDKDISTPPGSPTEGDRYIVGPAATGAWAGQEDNVAIWIDAQGAGPLWEFRTPKLGWVAFVQDESFQYFYNGSGWVLYVAPQASSEPVTDIGTTGALIMDLNLGRNFRVPGATGNVTLAFTNIPAGVRTEIAFTWVQDGVGGHTLGFPAGSQSPGGVPPVASTGPNERDEYFFSIDDAGVISLNVVGQQYA